VFSQILDKLDTWLGRSFLLARYFPWLLFAAANLLMAAAQFPAVRGALLAEYSRVASSDKAIDLVLALGAVAVIAYIVSPAILPITRVLEGQSLWQCIAEPLLLRRWYQLRALADRRKQLFQDRAGMEEKKPIIKRLAAFRQVGREYGTITDSEAITRAETELIKLRPAAKLNRPIKAGELAVAIVAMADALQKNCADPLRLKPPISKTVEDNARRLDKLHRELTNEILPYAIEIAETRERHELDVNEKLFGSVELAPTRLGNDVAALRSYCNTRYGLEFDFFWPRLQLVMKDDKLAGKLSAAQIQVEFSILALTLSTVFVAFWLIELGGWGDSFTSLLLLAVLGPPVIAIFLWLVHGSYSIYAELVRGSIDVSRFDLLQALRRPLPQSTEAEIAVWQQTARLLVFNEHDVDVALKHPGT
jgi:hypothetical protein